MPVLSSLRETIARAELFPAGATVIVGVSGGADSLCLLHALRALAPEMSLALVVGHLHHGLRGEEADADAAFVRDLAAQWDLPCHIGYADVPDLARRQRLAIEETARRARYAFLGEVARAVGAPYVAVGHNADDQAETVLMHLLRGAAISGLRGMLPKTPWGEYRLLPTLAGATGATDNPRWLVRPLLSIPRAEIAAYCAEHGLQPRFDRSNLDTTFFRNRLRHHLLPILETYNPAVRQILQHTATVMADDYTVLRAALDAAWAEVERPAPEGAIAFDRAAWRALSRGLQRSTLREAVHRLRRTLRDINIEHALQVARAGETGSQATLPQGLMLRVDYERIVIADASAPLTPARGAWPAIVAPTPLLIPGVTLLDNDWQITARLLSLDALPAGWDATDDPWQAWLDADALGAVPQVRPRRPGDRFQPLGMGGRSTKLNELMINLKLPAALRAMWPLIEGRSGLAWLVGYRSDERARVGPTTRRVVHLICSPRRRFQEQGEGSIR